MISAIAIIANHTAANFLRPCKVVADALRAQTQETDALRHNSQMLETAIRGSDYAYFEGSIAPRLIPVPTEETVRSLGLAEVLLRDRCPSQ
jgi:hypothetical protein